MPFATTTLDRIMGILNLPLTRFYVEAVQDALNHAEVYGGEGAIARIEGYLAAYDSQQTALSEGAANAGLVQAGPLKWALGSRNAGYKSETNRLKGAIASALNLTQLIPRTGTVRLIRG